VLTAHVRIAPKAIRIRLMTIPMAAVLPSAAEFRTACAWEDSNLRPTA
jgi:hypothetical protein